jgi:hypothetical protein
MAVLLKSMFEHLCVNIAEKLCSGASENGVLKNRAELNLVALRNPGVLKNPIGILKL